MKFKFLLLLLIHLNVIWCDYDDRRYYEGYHLKKGLKRQKSEQDDFILNHQKDDPNAPVWTHTLIGHTYNSSEAKIRFDVSRQVIYLLTFEMNGTKIIESSLFISSSMGANYVEKDLKYRDKDVIITDLYVGPGIVIAYGDFDYVTFVSVDSGETWKASKFPFKVKEVQINFLSPYKVAAITEYNYLYFMINNGSSWSYRTYGVSNGTWEYGSTYFYFLQNTYVSSGTYRKDMYRASVESYSVPRIFADIYKIESGFQLLSVVAKSGSNLDLFIAHREDTFRHAVFPLYLRPKDFFVHSSRQSEIFVILVNATNQVYLYSGVLREMKFFRVSDDVGTYYDATKSFCADFESFYQLPGVLLSQKLRGSGQTDQAYTAVSFSHGMKWTHVNAPRFIDGRLCEWPSCYLRLSMKCLETSSFRPITTVDGAPAVMVAYGSIIRINEMIKPGIFISTDAGKTWIRGIRNGHSFTVLDKGGIIFTYPELSHQAYYSYDFGLTWKLANVTNDKFRALGTFHDAAGVSSIAATVGYDEDTMDWSFIKIDFTNAIQKECNLRDYDVFTPGSSQNDQCFQGKKNSIYKRKHNVTCKSIIDKLPAIEAVPCPCNEDDFGCSFGYYLRDNDCVIDPDHIPRESPTCTPGEFIIRPSSKSKLIGDVCIENGKYVDTESDICSFTDNDNTLSILVGKVVKYTNLNGDKPTTIAKLPVEIKSYTNPIAYDMDHFERCLYYANSTGIYKTCYNVREEALAQNQYVLLTSLNLVGMEIDEFTDNLYYYTKNVISVIHVFSRYRKVLIKTDVEIEYFNIYPTRGLMVYVSANSRSVSKNDRLVNVFTLYGEHIGTINVDLKVNAVAFSVEENKFYVYCNDFYYTAKSDGTQKEKKSHDHKGIINAYVKNNKQYIVTVSYIAIDKTKIYQNFISDSDLHVVSDHEFKSECSISGCKYLCFSDENKGYKCGCPENMDRSEDGKDCVCDSLNPNCKECSPSEFHCKNQKCIPINGKCNGVDNCGDKSDEEDCKLVCKVDELSCDNNTKCIDAINICDGTKYCADGADEIGCEDKPKCDPNQFQCINGNCIPLDKVCNGVNDCGDFSDEDSCSSKDCRSFEVKCKNGECILPSQICNNVFDCSDWSDETDCHGKPDDEDPLCVIRCDGKCIPREKMCDHITDCSQGQDEINCAHIFECPTAGQEKCATSFSCYEAHRKCDGFTECEDGSDEVNCPDFDFCSDPESFTCDSDYNCLPINKYCDNVKDCDDESDEGAHCLNNPHVQMIQIDKRNDGSMDVSWIVSRPKSGKGYNVTLKPKNPALKVQNFATYETSATIYGLLECELYTLYVRIAGSIAGRTLQFVAKRANIGIPRDSNYDSTNNFLTWNSKPSSCIPEVFYIECKSGDQVAYRNFSKLSSLQIRYNSSYECQVSSCLATIFNISCSDFTPIIYLSSYNTSQKFIKIGLPIIIFLVISVVCGYGLYKLYKTGKLRFITELVSRSVGFKKVSVSQQLDAGKLFDDHDDTDM